MTEQIIEFSNNHPFLVFGFAATLGLILFTEFRRVTQKFTNVAPPSAIDIINNDNAVLLDVREQSELSDGMLNDAIHIPMSAMGSRVSELDKYKDNTILVYCRSGNRSGGACRTLTNRGFEKVYNLAGGIMAWKDAHLPVSTGKSKKK